MPRRHVARQNSLRVARRWFAVEQSIPRQVAALRCMPRQSALPFAATPARRHADRSPDRDGQLSPPVATGAALISAE